MSPSTRRRRPGDPQAKVKTDLHLDPPSKELAANPVQVKKIELPDSYEAKPAKKAALPAPSFEFAAAASPPLRRRGYRGPSLEMALAAATLAFAVLMGLWHGGAQLPAAEQVIGWLKPTTPDLPAAPTAPAVMVEEKPAPLQLVTVEPVPEQAPAPSLAKEPEPEPVVVAVAAPPPPPEPAIPVKPEACLVCKIPKGTYGTSVNFQADPVDAAKQALADKKLFFVITISGNFEDSKFT